MVQKKPFVELTLKLLNSILILISLTSLLYGLYCLFTWKQFLRKSRFGEAKFQIPARILLALDASNWLSDKLPSAWFIYLILAMAATLFAVGCLGYVGTAARSPCCLYFYSVLLVGLVLAQLGMAALVFFAHNSNEVFPRDRTGSLNSTYNFLNQNWKIIRWFALAKLTLEVIAILLALYLRRVNQTPPHDGGDREKIIVVRPDFRQRKASRKSNIASSALSAGGRNRTQIIPKKTSS